MSILVLDASVAIKWVLREPGSAIALNLRDEYRRQVHELIAPDTFAVEVAHALTRAERRGIIKVGMAAQLLAEVMRTAPILHPYLPLMTRAVDLSSQARIGVYDALFVALAEREACDLITADDKLIKALPGFPLVSLDTL